MRNFKTCQICPLIVSVPPIDWLKIRSWKFETHDHSVIPSPKKISVSSPESSKEPCQLSRLCLNREFPSTREHDSRLISKLASSRFAFGVQLCPPPRVNRTARCWWLTRFRATCWRGGIRVGESWPGTRPADRPSSLPRPCSTIHVLHGEISPPECTSPALSISSDPPVSATLSLSVPVTSIKIPAVDEPLFRAIVRRF